MKGSRDYLKLGRWNLLCDVCGQKKKSDEVGLRWDGAYVCREDWEPRHPMDFLRAFPETSNILPWSRNQALAAFPDVSPHYIA